jgi:hypothetical protein
MLRQLQDLEIALGLEVPTEDLILEVNALNSLND